MTALFEVEGWNKFWKIWKSCTDTCSFLNLRTYLLCKILHHNLRPRIATYCQWITFRESPSLCLKSPQKEVWFSNVFILISIWIVLYVNMYIWKHFYVKIYRYMFFLNKINFLCLRLEVTNHWNSHGHISHVCHVSWNRRHWNIQFLTE